MEKDYFSLITDDGNEKKMEIVSTFNINNSSYNYIIYREIDKSHYYIAKYLGDEIVDLDTNISDDEYEVASKILEGIMDKNEIRN